MDKLNTNVTSFDEKHYISKTCNTHIKKIKVPCQAMTNGIYLENILEELDCLNTLGVVLNAKRLLFKETVIMSKGNTKTP